VAVLHCTLKAYSYGDSAGFTPDFPFNGAGRQPITCANVGNKNICQTLFLFQKEKEIGYRLQQGYTAPVASHPCTAATGGTKKMFQIPFISVGNIKRSKGF
jgi:hypothetical protein